MACRTGETLTALFINGKLAADRTLVMVPSLSLLGQTLREWMANTMLGFDEFLPVCSAGTCGRPLRCPKGVLTAGEIADA